MTDKQIIIDGFNLEYIKELLYNGQRSAITTKIFEEIIEKLERKEQECEELEKELRQKKMTILMNNDHYLNVDQKNKKLKQTLTEIKEIAEHCIKQDICTTCDNSEKCHIEDEEIPTYDVCKLILQKISEVEDDNR